MDVPAGGNGGGFYADPDRGAALWRLGERLRGPAEAFAVANVVLDGVPHQAVFHYMWANPQRTAAFAIIGFIVDLDDLRRHRFGRLAAADLEPLLNLGAELPRLALRVEDAGGRRIAGAGPRRQSAAVGVGARRPAVLPQPRAGQLSCAAAAGRSWRLIVRPEAPLPDGSASGVWLLGAVVGLLLIAVVCAVGVNREALRLSQLQSDFVLNVSHQLRTPLAMLSGAAETLGLERLRSPEKIKHYADIVQAQTVRLSALVDQHPSRPYRRAAGAGTDLAALRSRRAGRPRRGRRPAARRSRGSRDRGRPRRPPRSWSTATPSRWST